MNELFYRPLSAATGKMWDTWLYWRDGVYYLYYLANASSRWDNISLATSTDGVDWKEYGVLLAKDPDPSVVWMGTGSTWASPGVARDGKEKFFMNFSYSQSGQRILMVESTDLIHWHTMDPATTTRPDTRWYQISDDDAARWDCIFTCPRDEGGLWGYWTASPIAHHGVAFGWSPDGFTWQALPAPVIDPPLEIACEHGGVARVGGRYYHMLGVGAHGTMHVYIADGPQGPLRPAAVNADLLGQRGVYHTYFARFFNAPDGLLVNHHAIGRDGMVYFGLLKRAVFDDTGTMRLGWWESNDRLKTRPMDPFPRGVSAKVGDLNVTLLPTKLPTDEGLILEGRVDIPASSSDAVSGLFIRTSYEEGAAILIGPDGVARFGRLPLNGADFQCEATINREFDFGRSAPFRLVLKRDILEFYLSDILIHCYSLAAPADGSVGTIGHVSELAAWG